MGQGHLRFASAAAIARSFDRSTQPCSSRDRGPKYAAEKGAEEDQAAQAGIALADVQRVAALGHGPLVQDLPGDQERGPNLRHQFLGPAELEDAAVQAGVDLAAITVLRLGKHVQVVLAALFIVQLHAEPARGGRGGVAIALAAAAEAEGTGEIEGLDLNPLLE